MQPRIFDSRVRARLVAVIAVGATAIGALACSATDDPAAGDPDLDGAVVLSADATVGGPAIDGTSADNAAVDSPIDTPDSGPPAPSCGNGIVEAGEDCDGVAHAGQSCASRGFDGGQLRCTLKCRFDSKLCHRCGNGKLEPGESCDGNCPTSCPAPSDPCTSWTLLGSASTCDARCVSSTLPGCNPVCPKNGTPSTQLGSQVFSGDFINEADRLTASGQCKLHGRDAVYAWQAPADGVYDFGMCALGKFVYVGSVVERSSCSGSIALVDGTTCTAGFTVTGCKSAPNATMRATMTAGQQVLVVASNWIDTDSSDGIYDITSPYTISIKQCLPSCAAKSCGDDGCGGSCGSCAAGTSCSAASQCVCTPKCSNKSCGDDGCGGSCGSCYGNKVCSSAGQCLCTPSCSNKSCGSDGCGGSCGSCAPGSTCSAGSCVAAPNSCDPVGDIGCSAPEQCWLLSNEDTVCAITGYGRQGDSCSSTSDCDGGHGCFAGTCRKICRLVSDAGCVGSQICNGVSGWTQHGACYQP